MIDKTPEAVRWLGFAEEDLKVAEIILEEGIYNQVCFHSQQCVEKSLKAILVKNNQKIPRIHSIGDLLGICEEISKEDFAQFEDIALILDQYYKPTRYPDAIIGSLPDGLPDEEDAREALDMAKEIFKFIQNTLKKVRLKYFDLCNQLL